MSSAWNFTYLGFIKEFKKVREGLQLPDLVPYMCRHSGPSVDRANGWRSQEEVRKRGRWRAHRSMVRYEKAARLAVTARSYKPDVDAFMVICERDAEALLLGTKPLDLAAPV